MSQHQTAPITKSGTSENSSPKKRGAPKGGWKKAKEEKAKAEALLKGNQAFNVNDPTVQKNIKETVIDMSSYSPEDMALDAELDALAQQRAPVSDSGPAMEVTKPKEHLEHLRDHVEGEYKPAASMADLTEQVHLAKSVGADSIDGTQALVKQIFRIDYDKILKTIGYGIYHDVRVYISGKFDETRHLDKQTMEQKLFPNKS